MTRKPYGYALAVIVILSLFIWLALGMVAVYAETGKASFYGKAFHGRTMANGKRFDMHAAVCAHRRHPFGMLLRVTNLRNGKTAVCRVADRGPFVGGRIVDVSRGVAGKLGMIKRGVVRVTVEVVR